MNEFLWACWDILVDSSLWMLFGFFMAGLLRAFVPSDLVARHLGRNQSGNIFKAALFGVPLPLCSCGVIPAAAGLRRQGAGKGATASFLISTPETGVDSMAVSWALLDPLMTVLRPASAFLTAMVTGVLIDAADKEPVKEPGKDAESGTGKGALQDLRPTPDLAPLGAASACASGCCSCGGDPAAQSRFRRFLDGQRFAFDDLLADIAPWFTLGILLAGVITVYLPDDLGRMLPGGGLTAMLAMLAVALPMYVCATASTPIAAALALKGFSPGALLVFLLAGPATNAATMVMVGRMLGKKSAIIYVGSIIAVTLVCAVAADALYLWLGYEVHAWLGDLGSEEGGLLSVVAALVMLAILGRALALMAMQKFGRRG
ncbi:hypothetical protein SAMN05421830_105148 [Desulfomicrobium norvegicum]|uniref:Permease n=1 Tax=Desulfomicrobium norvegicum (strain DSM 1741 / NCIMB 8310) TaxID=52561 RepID=A0A8G2C2V3_DESNO|nr:SO_0444 family Cu/Zn efflux transporter [Desulfomicrobium norvegicum]SFL72035.1 hypothetical protein SAMN05421830_105148 [Desulfomicrobium norvegicum]